MKKKGYYAHDYQYDDKAIEAEMIAKRLENSSKSEENCYNKKENEDG